MQARDVNAPYLRVLVCETGLKLYHNRFQTARATAQPGSAPRAASRYRGPSFPRLAFPLRISQVRAPSLTAGHRSLRGQIHAGGAALRDAARDARAPVRATKAAASRGPRRGQRLTQPRGDGAAEQTTARTGPAGPRPRLSDTGHRTPELRGPLRREGGGRRGAEVLEGRGSGGGGWERRAGPRPSSRFPARKPVAEDI